MTDKNNILQRLADLQTKKAPKEEVTTAEEVTSKISKIERQKKDPSRYSIFIDGAFAFGLDEGLLLKYQLNKGIILTKEEQKAILADEALKQGINKALNYLSYQPRSRKEVVDKLSDLDYVDEQIQLVIARLEDYGYINDAQFAKQFTLNQANIRREGPQVIRRKMISKGLDEEAQKEGLSFYPWELQAENAAYLADKYYNKQLRKYPARIAQGRTRQHLMQKGFPADIIDQTMTDLERDLEEEVDQSRDLVEKAFVKAQRQYRKLSDQEKSFKIKQALYRKGFDDDSITWIMSQNHED